MEEGKCNMSTVGKADSKGWNIRQFGTCQVRQGLCRPGEEVGLYFKCYRKPSKDFKREDDMIWFVFLKDRLWPFCGEQNVRSRSKITKTKWVATVRVYVRDDNIWTKAVAVEIERNFLNYNTFKVALIFNLTIHRLSTLQNPMHVAGIHLFYRLVIVYCMFTMCQMQEQGNKDTLNDRCQLSFQQIILLSHQDQST